jgi:hypothetical protein
MEKDDFKDVLLILPRVRKNGCALEELWEAEWCPRKAVVWLLDYSGVIIIVQLMVQPCIESRRIEFSTNHTLFRLRSDSDQACNFCS